MQDNAYKNCDLSVVIAAKNEEEMIKDCIESVLSSLEFAREKGVIESSEVILADSASTDKTVDIALKYPIKIIQLKKNWPLSAAAGFYIGYLHTNGKYVYFLGGDMVLDREWFANAIPYLNDEKIGAISGIEEEFLDESTLIGRKMKEFTKLDMPVGEVEMVGTAIFKRKVLEEVGPHNPYLKGGEDRDLAYRIRAADYKLIRINSRSVLHYWAKKDGKLTLKRYLRSAYNWSMGDGQAMRSTLNNKKVAIEHLKRYFNTFFIRIYGAIFLFISFIYMNILTIMLTSQTLAFTYFTLFIDTVLAVLALTYMLIRYKGENWDEFIFSFHVIPYVFVRHIGFITGFLKKPKAPSMYPTDVKVIKN